MTDETLRAVDWTDDPMAEARRIAERFPDGLIAWLLAARPASIDVERLARAMRAEDKDYAAEWRAGRKRWTWEDRASRLAAEYARLTAEGSET